MERAKYDSWDKVYSSQKYLNVIKADITSNLERYNLCSKNTEELSEFLINCAKHDPRYIALCTFIGTLNSHDIDSSPDFDFDKSCRHLSKKYNIQDWVGDLFDDLEAILHSFLERNFTRFTEAIQFHSSIIDIQREYRDNYESLESDYNAAFAAKLAAAQTRSAADMFEVSLCFEHGHGVKQDNTAAFEWRVKAAEAGHYYAQLDVAQQYSDSANVNYDLIKASYFSSLAAAQNAPDDLNKNSCEESLDMVRSYEEMLFSKQMGFKESLPIIINAYICAAKQGSCYAMGRLWILYQIAYSPILIPALYHNWYQSISDEELNEIKKRVVFFYNNYFNSFHMIRYGIYDYSFPAILNRALQNSHEDQLMVASSLEGGDFGLEPNYLIRYHDWLLPAATGEDILACERLVFWYEEYESADKALPWMMKLVELGERKYILRIAEFYEGKGDYTEAFKWYKAAEEKNLSKGYLKLSLFYEKGLGTEPDLENALIYCAWATSEQSRAVRSRMRNLLALITNSAIENREALLELYNSLNLRYGIFVEEDWDEADMHFERAAELGIKAAKDHVDRHRYAKHFLYIDF